MDLIVHTKHGPARYDNASANYERVVYVNGMPQACYDVPLEVYGDDGDLLAVYPHVMWDGLEYVKSDTSDTLAEMERMVDAAAKDDLEDKGIDFLVTQTKRQAYKECLDIVKGSYTVYPGKPFEMVKANVNKICGLIDGLDGND